MSEFDAPLEDVQPDAAQDDAGLFSDLGLADIELPDVDLPDVDLSEVDIDVDGMVDQGEELLADVEEWAGDLVEDIEIPDFVQELFDGSMDLIGADPDEQGLWNDLMLDTNDDVNPYVAN